MYQLSNIFARLKLHGSTSKQTTNIYLYLMKINGKYKPHNINETKQVSLLKRPNQTLRYRVVLKLVYLKWDGMSLDMLVGIVVERDQAGQDCSRFYVSEQTVSIDDLKSITLLPPNLNIWSAFPICCLQDCWNYKLPGF